MSLKLTESDIEETAIGYLNDLGYEYIHGSMVSPDTDKQWRTSYSDVIIKHKLKQKLEELNPNVPASALEEALKKLTRTTSPELIINNQELHLMLVAGVEVEYRQNDRIKNDIVKIFDFENPDNNEFLAVNQLTIIEGQNNRRPDIIIYINGLPVVVIELKNSASEDADIWSAYNQLQTYKAQISELFRYNAFLVISDGLYARAGTLTSDKERFMLWKTIDGEKFADEKLPQMKVLFYGMFQKKILLDLIRNFIVFEKEKKLIKKIAAYHQYHAVNKAVVSTIKASDIKGDKRAGVIWHTQGSGKSLLMVFYAGKLVQQLDNPTLVLLTDRNDLDEQLFATFSRCDDLLRQSPVQANSRENLKELLQVASGGIVFTTIQKFMSPKGEKYPTLSKRRNIIVIADEAHRSQYDFIDGFAKHLRDGLPNASFIGFTGTPIEKSDKSTPAVFGNYIDIYDIEQAVKDEATVKIFYESRLAKLELKEDIKEHLDEDFEEVTEGEEFENKERMKSRWARLEAIVGSKQRIQTIAKDIVSHFEARQNVVEGKAMIVCMSRRICIDLHNEIAKLRPEWIDEDDDKGSIKVIMTGSASDPVDWQQHIRNKQRRKSIGTRVKDASDPLKIVIVRDMWLTGFDAPSLHTMYIDKPMKSHGLMQAIARVNRVYKDKPGGLIVDYIGIADALKNALSEYTEGDRKHTGINKEEAISLMLEKYEIVVSLMDGFDYHSYERASTGDEKLGIVRQGINFILEDEEKKEKFIQYVTQLSQAFALAVPSDEAAKITVNVAYFQQLKVGLLKLSARKGSDPSDVGFAIRQIVSNALSSNEVLDLFGTAGLKKPDISILSEEFLAEVKGMQHKNLAVELLKKLLNDEIRRYRRTNIIQAKSFKELLEIAINKYHNKSIETVEILEELIELSRQMREASKRGEKLGLSTEELAFYDSLETNDSAVKILGDDTLRDIARDLVKAVKGNVSIDWTLRESVRAKMRVMVKRILKQYGYPPDLTKRATETVLEQAESFSERWAVA